jgi:hypothetical protein
MRHINQSFLDFSNLLVSTKSQLDAAHRKLSVTKEKLNAKDDALEAACGKLLERDLELAKATDDNSALKKEVAKLRAKNRSLEKYKKKQKFTREEEKSLLIHAKAIRDIFGGKMPEDLPYSADDLHSSQRTPSPEERVSRSRPSSPTRRKRKAIEHESDSHSRTRRPRTREPSPVARGRPDPLIPFQRQTTIEEHVATYASVDSTISSEILEDPFIDASSDFSEHESSDETYPVGAPYSTPPPPPPPGGTGGAPSGSPSTHRWTLPHITYPLPRDTVEPDFTLLTTAPRHERDRVYRRKDVLSYVNTHPLMEGQKDKRFLNAFVNVKQIREGFRKRPWITNDTLAKIGKEIAAVLPTVWPANEEKIPNGCRECDASGFPIRK